MTDNVISLMNTEKPSLIIYPTFRSVSNKLLTLIFSQTNFTVTKRERPNR